MEITKRRVFDWAAFFVLGVYVSFSVFYMVRVNDISKRTDVMWTFLTRQNNQQQGAVPQRTAQPATPIPAPVGVGAAQ